MKTIYPLQNREPRRRSRRGVFFLLGIVAACFSLGVALLAFVPQSASGVGLLVATPVWAVRLFVSDRVAYVGTFFHTHRSLVEENERLKTELVSARANMILSDALALEHEKLLAAYGRSESFKRTLGVVLTKPPQSLYDTMVIDIGARRGVRPGDYVYSFGNTALGTVSSVADDTASITLFSNGDRETQATIERSDTSLTLIGLGGGGFEAKIPQDMDVVLGDIVVVPALHAAILGKVVAVESTDASSFKRVLVQSPVNIHTIRWLEVDTGQEKTP